MSFDWTTEVLSHFIGLFEIADERARLRDDYDRFKRDQARDEEMKFETMGAVKNKAPFKLDKFTPHVKYKPVIKGELSETPFSPYAVPVDISPVWVAIPLPYLNYLELWGQDQGQDQNTDGPQTSISVNIQMSLEPAGSVAVYSKQQASLIDNDVISGDGTIDFLPTDGFTATTNFYTYLAHNMQGLKFDTLPGSGGAAVKTAQSLKSTIAAAKENGPLEDAPESAEVSVQIGTDANGLRINGEQADEVPNLPELMPQRLQVADNTADEAPEEVTLLEGTASMGEAISGIETDAPTQSGDAPKKAPSQFEVPDGHNVVMGGNSLINEMNISSNWLDAPVMAVMGNVFSINAVNQVNVVSDRDSGLAQTTDSATQALNISQINHYSNPFAPSAGILPAHWVVAKIEADVISANWVEQFTFALDHDIAEVTFTGQDTFLQLGDNSIVNVANLQEIGFGYDLIYIGGSFINLNAISQTNVLYDDDFISASDGTPGTVNSSGNLLANFANISTVGVDSYSIADEGIMGAADAFTEGFGKVHEAFADFDAFNGVNLMRVLHIAGDLIQMNLAKQTNILGDADQVHVAFNNFLGQHDDVSVNTGDNALVNVANIGTYGVDSEVYVGGEVYSDAFLVQADLIDTDADPLGVSLSSGT